MSVSRELPLKAADGRALVARTFFTQTVSVAIEIAADQARLWHLLTDAAGFPRWNSTVASIEGTIAAGQTLALRVPGSNMVMRPKISGFEPPHRMVWSGGAPGIFLGVRTFILTPCGPQRTIFAMSEKFSGAMWPLIGSKMPDFVPIFERYAADLKRAGESGV